MSKAGTLPKRILIVDDNTSIRLNIRATLEQHPGWEICGEAVNGIDALHKNQELHPDLIVLDLSMPVMNGLEAARHLKQSTPSIILIMFSSFATTQLRNEAMKVGILDVVSKDTSVHLLTESIERSLETQSARPV